MGAMNDRKRPAKVGIYTLGCRVNLYESRAVAERIAAAGYSLSEELSGCDACFINTCAVTAESERKCRQMIRRARKSSPGAFIALAGCASQLAPEGMALNTGADFAAGSRNKLEAADAIIAYLDGKRQRPESPLIAVTPPDSLPYERMSLRRGPESEGARTRAYVKIEDGCNGRCAYCVIKNARGRVVLRDHDDIIDEVKTLAAAGYREVVLTGIETAAYGAGLIPLIGRTAEVEGIERLRLGSLDPSFVGRRFADDMAAIPKLMPHLHLSAQSGSDSVLRAMRRGYTRERMLENIDYLRQKISGIRFTADMIAGFPGETERDFEKTLELVREVRFLHVHVFPFSARRGTEAYDMPGRLPGNVVASRADALTALMKEVKSGVLDEYVRPEQPLQILCESCDEGIVTGHTPFFAPMRVKTDRDVPRGELILAKAAGHDGETLCGIETA